MAKITGAEIMVKVFKDFGLDTVFALISGHFDPFFKCATEANFTLCDHHHEQAAGFAAAGYARMTGKPGIAAVACGGGVTNVVTPVANAFTDAIPMIVLGGQSVLRDYGTFALNMIGDGGSTQCDIMRPITKWSVQVPHISRLADMLGTAIRKATSGRPGPVYLDMPLEVVFGEIEESEVRYLYGDVKCTPPAPAPAAVDFIAQKILEAKHPLILAGAGTIWSNSAKDLLKLAELTNIPVLTNNKSRGIMPTEHPLWGKGFSTISAAAHRGVTPDLLIFMGARMGLYTGGAHSNFIPEESYIIQVDIEPSEMGRIRDADYAVAADCRETITALQKVLETKELPDFSEWAGLIAQIAADSKQKALALGSGDGKLTPGAMAVETAKAIPEDAVIVLDGGETGSWADAVMNTDGPNKYMHHGYVGCMGEGMPNAVGAAVAYPDKYVILYTGDGALGFNFMEFETMVRHNFKVIVVVSMNKAWGMSAHGHDIAFGEGNHYLTDFGLIRFDLAAEGLGAYGELVTELSEVGPAIKRAMASGKPACINVVQHDVTHPITYRFAKNDINAEILKTYC